MSATADLVPEDPETQVPAGKGGRRALLALLVLAGGLGLAWLAGRLGPPRRVTLTLVGPAGGEALVAGGFRGSLPFTVELLLTPSPEGTRPELEALLTGELPGAQGLLRDGLEPAAVDRPARWWVAGERGGLRVEEAFSLEAWDAEGNVLMPVELVQPGQAPDGPARTVRLAPAL